MKSSLLKAVENKILYADQINSAYVEESPFLELQLTSFGELIPSSRTHFLSWPTCLSSIEFQNLKSLLQENKPFQVELSLHFTKDEQAKFHTYDFRFIPKFDHLGHLECFFGMGFKSNEFSNAQKIENQIYLDNQKLEYLFDNSPMGIAILKGKDLVFEKANDNFMNFFHHRDIINKSMIEAFPEILNHPQFIQVLLNVFTEKIPFNAKEQAIYIKNDVTKKSKMDFFDFSLQPLYANDGSAYGVIVYLLYVTDKVEAKKKIQESELEFRSLTEAIPQIIFTLNTQGEKIFINDRWQVYTGCFSKNKFHFFDNEHYHPDEVSEIHKKWHHSFQHTIPFQMEYRIKSAKGYYRWFLVRAIPIFDEEKNVLKWVGTKTDIHNQKQLHQDLESLVIENNHSKELAESANQAKTAFLANMSHEIRTPLGSIMGFINLLKNPVLSKDNFHKYITIVERNSVQLMRIIDEILDISKIEAGKLVIEEMKFNFHALLRDITSLMEFKAHENGITFSVHTLNKVPKYIISDPTRIKQILLNIIGNAIKFTPKGKVELFIKFQKNILTFEVKDTGIGISEEQSTQLFNAFTQGDVSTTRRFGGTGLGLTLTQRLTKALGGEFYLKDSELNVGSTFVATLKVQLADQLPSKDDSNLHPTLDKNITLNNKRILVIDDFEDNLTLIKVLLENHGAYVDALSNSHLAVQKVAENHYDVILTDIQMPGMNGYEVAAQIRSIKANIPIIALTAHAMKSEKMTALNFGFSGFLTKPINHTEMIQTIVDLTEKHKVEKEICIVEDDQDISDLLTILLKKDFTNVNILENAEELLKTLKFKKDSPSLILVDYFLPHMSGADLIARLNERDDRKNFKVIVASGVDNISEVAKNLGADGYLKKPYNTQTITKSIRAFLS